MLLVTGSKGFIGKKVYDKVSLLSSVQTLENNFGGNFEDKQDIEYIRDIDSIIHCAAVVPKNYFTDESRDSLLRNTTMTYNLLEKYRKVALEYSMFVFTSSISVGHQNPYSLGKEFGEKLCAYYNLVYNLNIAALRIPSPFGPGMGTSVIDIFIRRALNDIELFVYNTEKKQTFMYIDDVVDWIIKTYEDKESGIFDIRSYQPLEISMEELALLVIDTLGSKSEIRYLDPPKRYDEPDVILDQSKDEPWGRTQMSPYMPTYTLKDGILEYVKYIEEKENENISHPR